jgi:hypothetical protein
MDSTLLLETNCRFLLLNKLVLTMGHLFVYLSMLFSLTKPNRKRRPSDPGWPHTRCALTDHILASCDDVISFLKMLPWNVKNVDGMFEAFHFQSV